MLGQMVAIAMSVYYHARDRKRKDKVVCHDLP